MNIAITDVHLDLGAGRRGTDMGPSAIHVAGIVKGLETLGHHITEVHRLEAPSRESLPEAAAVAHYLPQITACCAELATHVHRHMTQGWSPLVLGGDHSQAIGTIAGMTRHLKPQGQRLGVIWVDAHCDMNTPESSPSGNIHGMPLAVLLGHGHAELTALCGDDPALRPQDIVVIGARDVDSTEAPVVADLGVRVITMSEIDERGMATCMRDALAHLASTDALHLSFDLDGVDPRDAPGVGTPVPGGLSLRESHLICESVARTGRLRGMEMVELNPTMDIRNKTAELAVWLIMSAMGKTIL